MKKTKRIFASVCALAVLVTGFSASAKLTKEDMDIVYTPSVATEEFDATVVVNENNPLHAAEHRVLSAQCELADGAAQYFMDFDSLTFKPEWMDFVDEIHDYPVFRWGGATAEHTNFMKNIGPMSQRSGSTHQFTGAAGATAQHFGLVEFLKWMYTINPDGEFMPSVTMTYGTPEDSAHLAQFLCDEAGESEWGALRAQYGLIEPVKVFAFEMGNEVDIDSGFTNEETGEYWPKWENNEEYTDFGNWYADVAIEHCKAIREVCPEAKFVILGKSHNLRHPSVEAMMRPVIEKLQDYIDYISWHAYYDGVSQVSSYDHAYQILEICEEVMGPDHGVKMAATEHARWYDSSSDAGYRRASALKGALSNARFFSRGIREDVLAVANYHGIQGSNHNLRGWGSYWATDLGFRNAMVGEMIKVYATGLGDRVVEYEVESENPIGDMYTHEARFSALVTARGDRELDIILVSERDEYEINLTFDFKNQYTLKEETIFTAPNGNSIITTDPADESPLQVTVTEKNEANFTSYRMPAKSMVILKLESNKKLPQLGENKGGTDIGAAEHDAAFDDITYHWAKNEVSALAELGLVQGNGEGLFLPEDGITRAEFAAMLTRALNLKTDYPNAYFDDISPDAWYAKEVNAVFCEGLMKGKGSRQFAPEDNITLEEVIAVASRAYRARNSSAEAINTSDVLAGMPASEHISSWAKEDVAYAVGAGLMQSVIYGDWGNAPKSATRAQTAVMVYTMHSLLN